MSFAINTLLGFMVLLVWLGCLGFARMRTPLDRLHCVAFVNVTAGSVLALAAFLSDGASVRAGKILMIVATSLLTGAAMSHATGRMVLAREWRGDVSTRGSTVEAMTRLPPEQST